jgi:pimeloyl-ACP methyl ester carboxylesterase
MSTDGLRIATYDFPAEAPDAPVVIALHGFASSATTNWVQTGWTRHLERAGLHVIAYDQRGHGASDKPHSPVEYSMELLVADLLAVLDTYGFDEAALIGYSLGARVSWHAALELPTRVTRAVLGGIPDGDPLTAFRADDARTYAAGGPAVTHPLTNTYLTMAEGIPGNDLEALVGLVEGIRGGPQPDPRNPPGQPLFFATGSEDPIIDGSRALAAASPHAKFFEIPHRTHFNAPTSRPFRERAVAFLLE